MSRWALMRCSSPETLSAHSHETAILAHALITLHNLQVKPEEALNPERAACLGLFHDATEVLTGDLPTPVKYHNLELRAAYAQVEDAAAVKLLSLLPESLRPVYLPFFVPQEEDAKLWRFVKAADKLSALIKCTEEQRAGNREFTQAHKSILHTLQEMQLSAVDCFLQEHFPAFLEPLDGMININQE